MSNKGMAFVLSAPSGTGKTTLSRALLKLLPDLSYSVSATTRPKREGEVEGSDYFFLTEAEFKKKNSNGEFLESANVYGNWYGTPRSHVEKVLSEGKDILLDVDVQGAKSIKQNKLEAVYIFLVPPSLGELKDRLKQRKTEDEKTLNMRLEKAQDELKEYDLYDYVVVNDVLEEALQRIKAIILSEKSRIPVNKTLMEQIIKSS